MNDRVSISKDGNTQDSAPITRKDSGGGGGGAPTNAQYLVLTANATLTGERVFTLGTGLAGVDSGANNPYTLSWDDLMMI